MSPLLKTSLKKTPKLFDCETSLTQRTRESLRLERLPSLGDRYEFAGAPTQTYVRSLLAQNGKM